MTNKLNGGENMPIPRDEGMNLPAPVRGAFGRTSEERNKIIASMADGNFYTIDEISDSSGLDAKLVKTRVNVMYRDKLIERRSNTDGVLVVALTDKGLQRAGGEKPAKKSRKKKR